MVLLTPLKPKAYLSQGKAWVSNHAHVLRPKPGMLRPEFLKYYLDQLDYHAHVHGTTCLKLTKTSLKSLPILLPSLAEQNAMVSFVKKWMDQLNAWLSELKALQTILSQLKNKVWQKSFEGLPQVPLASLLKRLQYGSVRKSDAKGLLPVLRMLNIKDGEINWENLVYSSHEGDLKNFRLDAGDLLFNRSNSPEQVGKTALYRGERPAIFAAYLIRLSPSKHLDSAYLNEYLISPPARETLRKIKKDGIYQSNISGSKLKNLNVPLTSLEKQRKIAAGLLEHKKVFSKLSQELKALVKLLSNIQFTLLKRVYSRPSLATLKGAL